MINQWAERWRIDPQAITELRALMTVTAPTGGRKISEAAAQQEIRVEACRRGARLWRNNNGACQVPAAGRPIRYGLANDSSKINAQIKSSDLIGITPVPVTPSMVGHTLGVFTSVEVKRPGWSYKGTEREAAQLKWLELVVAFGGIAKFATSKEDL